MKTPKLEILAAIILSSICLVTLNSCKAFEKIKIGTKEPVPLSAIDLNSTKRLGSIEGFYADSSNMLKGLRVYRGQTDNDVFYLGSDIYEVVVSASKIILYQVTILEESDLETLPEEFVVNIFDDHLRIEYPGYLESRPGKEFPRYQQMKSRTNSEMRSYLALKKYAEGLDFDLRRRGDHLLVDTRYIGSIDIENGIATVASEPGKQFPIRVRLYDYGFVVNVELPKLEDWLSVFVDTYAENENEKVLVGHWDKSEVRKFTNLTIGLTKNANAIDKSYRTLFLKAGTFEGLALDDDLFTMSTFSKIVLSDSPFSSETMALKGLVNFEYWYVYVIVALGLLIIGLLCFIPLRFFS